MKVGIMNDLDFQLQDRIIFIQELAKQYDLSKAYISFSGGKDSVVLSYLFDLALPNNTIERVYFNTGIEYNLMIQFVKDLAKTDNRIKIINSGKNVRQTLEKVGYPFKSKEHSTKLNMYQNGSKANSVSKYLNNESFGCPKALKEQFTQDYNLKISSSCCKEFKKDIAKKYQKENNKSIKILAMRREEKGQRAKLKCISKTKTITNINPLAPITEELEEYIIKKYNIKLCPLYYEPYNFKRTGCKGCPYNLNLKEDLETMRKLLPNEYKQCYYIWGKVYNEYKRLNYRLDKYEKLNLF